MALNYADLAVTSTDVMDVDFFNTRYQLIANEVNAAETVASQYGVISNELLTQGLAAVNASLGPLVSELTVAATSGFLVTTSTTSLTLTTGDQSNFTVPTSASALFQPTPFLTIQDAGNAAHWATGNLASYNASTGALDIGITSTWNGSPVTSANWVIAAGSATLPGAVAAAATATTQAGDAATSATAAASSASAAAASAATCAADVTTLGGLITSAGVASVATLTGVVSASALKTALAITSSDVSGLVTLSSTIPGMDGTVSAGTATTASRQDHIHPTDSTRAPLASPTFTGTPAAPTATGGTNTTQLATTAFVGSAITTALTGLAPAVGVYYFGPGSDGTVTVSSGTTTLTRDMYYANLTLSGSGKINPNGFRIFVSGTLNLASAGVGAISMPGVAGSAGGVLSPSGFITGSSSGIAATTNNVCLGGVGGSSGTSQPADGSTPVLPEAFLQMVPYSTPYGAQANTVTGGGAGGYSVYPGGSGAGLVFIAANTLNRGSSSAAGSVSVIGGAGEPGGANSGAGGGGGGLVFLIVGSLTGTAASSLITATGGAGGTGTPSAGVGGHGGNIVVINLGANSVSTVLGSAASGTTGGTCAASV